PSPARAMEAKRPRRPVARGRALGFSLTSSPAVRALGDRLGPPGVELLVADEPGLVLVDGVEEALGLRLVHRQPERGDHGAELLEIDLPVAVPIVRLEGLADLDLPRVECRLKV